MPFVTRYYKKNIMSTHSVCSPCHLWGYVGLLIELVTVFSAGYRVLIIRRRRKNEAKRTEAKGKRKGKGY
jgi:hypothetical protein